MFKKRTIILIFVLQYLFGYGQNLAIGQWRIHAPFSEAISVAEAGNKVYCANSLGIFVLDRSDNSTSILDKTNGLSDIGISKLKYNHDFEMLVITYDNCNIDLIENNKIINISDIKRESISGEKKINAIDFRGNYAYLSCSFGVVVLDLTKYEIKDTYYIGDDGNFVGINDLTFRGNDSIFAATNDGVYSASLDNPNLANYESWHKISYLPFINHKINSLAYFSNSLFINDAGTGTDSDSLYSFDGSKWVLYDSSFSVRRTSIEAKLNKLVVVGGFQIEVFNSSLAMETRLVWYNSNPQATYADIGEDGNIWISDKRVGLLRNFDFPWNYQTLTPNGVPSSQISSLNCQNGNLWVASGGKDMAWGNIWCNKGMYRLNEDGWQNYNSSKVPILDTIFDILNVAIMPNEPNHIFACSWGKGLVEINNDQLVQLHNQNNSSLLNLQGIPGYYWLGISDAAFDRYSNLWVANSGVTNALSVRKADGTWKSFNLNSAIQLKQTGDMTIDSSDNKWIILPRGFNMVVFSDNGTIDDISDDKYTKLTTSTNEGKLPSSMVYSVAVDLDRKVWVGTDKGVAVFNNPENIFSGENYDAEQILVEKDGYYQYLLEFETVTSIAIDGANRKWFGTQNAGVFLISADGLTEIAHYTTENSTLISNNILSITINGENGEVFFGTDNGIISYMGNATSGKPEFSNVRVFPNPVKENYSGPIAINGMVRDANVKITDISGALVYEVTANGGEAIWNGLNLKGERVPTGVYMVFCADEKGKETFVAKILVAN